MSFRGQLVPRSISRAGHYSKVIFGFQPNDPRPITWFFAPRGKLADIQRIGGFARYSISKSIKFASCLIEDSTKLPITVRPPWIPRCGKEV